MPRRLYLGGKEVGSSKGIKNLTWQGIGLGTKAKQKALPFCNLCGNKEHRLRYERPPNTSITEDSHSWYYCQSCDQFSNASDYSDYDYEYDLKIEDAYLTHQIKKVYDRSLKEYFST
jgi:hypothetical protein